MSSPDITTLICLAFGGENAPGCLPFGNASNIVVGTNPPYTSDDFFGWYPNFAVQLGSPPTALIPLPVVNNFIGLANASLSQARWLEQWPFAMALFTAHFLTLYLKTTGTAPTSPAQAASQGSSSGLLTSKAVGDVSASYQQILLEGAGEWNQTEYGKQLFQMSRTVGFGPVFVW